MRTTKHFEQADDPKFSKTVKRDALLLLLIGFVSFLIVFLMPLIAYLGKKYNW